MDTVAAVDAFALVDLADSGFVIENGIHRTSFFTGALLMDDGAERACFGTHAAGFTLVGIDAHFGVTRRDGAEFAGIETRFAQTKAADVRHEIVLDRTVVTGSRDYRHYVLGGL